MNNFEKKLVNDSLPFKKMAVDGNVLEKLTRIINKSTVETETETSKFHLGNFNYKWMIPITIAVTFGFYNIFDQNTSKNIYLATLNVNLNKHYSTALISHNFDQKLMSSLVAEKKAINLDLNYIKNKFAL